MVGLSALVAAACVLASLRRLAVAVAPTSTRAEDEADHRATAEQGKG